MMFDMSTYERCRSVEHALPAIYASTTYADDVFRARLGGEHAQDAGAAADIEDELVLEEMRVLNDRIAVRACADGVFQHLFVDACRV